MNINKAEELAGLLAESKCSEITVSENGSIIHIKRAPGKIKEKKDPIDAAPVVHEKISDVKADMVGLFTFAANLRPGDTIENKQLIGRIKAFSIVNEIQAPCSGTVSEILCEDKSPVEYGQVIMTIKE